MVHQRTNVVIVALPKDAVAKIAAAALLAAADDFYGDTHPPHLSTTTWLRERAAHLLDSSAATDSEAS